MNLTSGTRVIHREFLFDVITSDVAGAFKIQTIPLQPALTSSFPWLAASAENYQEYKLNGCLFEFKSNSYNAISSTNTAAGTVVMSSNYNVLDPPFINKFQMEQSQYTCSTKPSLHLLHPIECAKMETPTSVLYTRPGPVSTGDLRLYDWCNFNIATVGTQGASTNIGELWITYDVTLLKPKLGSTVDVYDHYVLPIASPFGMQPGGPQFFGSVTSPGILTQDSDMGTTLSAVGSGSGLDTINWPVGFTGKVCVIYCAAETSTGSLVQANFYTTTSTSSVTPIPAFGLGQPSAYFTNQINLLLYTDNGGTTWVCFLSIVDGGSLTLAGGTNGANTLTSGDLFIISLPTNFDTLGVPPVAFSSTRMDSKTTPLDYKHGPYDSHTRSPSPDVEMSQVLTPLPEDDPPPPTILKRSLAMDIPKSSDHKGNRS